MRDYFLMKIIVNRLNQCGSLPGALTSTRSKVRDGAWFVRQEAVRVNPPPEPDIVTSSVNSSAGREHEFELSRRMNASWLFTTLIARNTRYSVQLKS